MGRAVGQSAGSDPQEGCEPALLSYYLLLRRTEARRIDVLVILRRAVRRLPQR